MVYLIHFATPLKHARHYIGYTSHGLKERIERHRAGQGARLMQVITEAGIEWDVVKTWPKGTRADERRLKNQKHAWKHCPVCRAERGMAR